MWVAKGDQAFIGWFYCVSDDSMQLFKKIFLLVAILTLGWAQDSRAFSLGGPIGNAGDGWQLPVIGYGVGDDLNAPKNWGQGYRRNTQTMYYAVDANFADYFGTNGLGAIQSSFAILNAVFTNNPTGNTDGLDGYSSSLSEFPFDASHINYQAQALGIMDVKTENLILMMEQLGLTDPIRYDWTLHDRIIPPGVTCPIGVIYGVVQRNFDTGGYTLPGSAGSQTVYSPYVDGSLYSYQILEACKGPNPLAVTVPILVSQSIQQGQESSVPLAALAEAQNFGVYYDGLSRDDVMGLRYMLTSNNVAMESISPDASVTLSVTNLLNESPFPVNPNFTNSLANIIGTNTYGTYNLGALIAASRVVDPVTLGGLFPGLIVATSSSQLVLVTNQTVVIYFTNYPGSAIGSPPYLFVGTNYSTGVATEYTDTFENVITNNYYPYTKYQVQTTTVGPIKGAAASAPYVTNTTYQTILDTNNPSGDYYYAPLGQCGLDITRPLLTNVYSVTNLSYFEVITNTTTTNSTTTSGTTNANNTVQSIAVSNIISYTNIIYATHPVTCSQTAGATALYEGVEKLDFVYSSYDSLVGQLFQPITNTYTMQSVVDGQVKPQTITRVVTAPDFVYSAADLVTPAVNTYADNILTRQVNFDQANILAGEAGPGTILTPTTITLNNSSAVFYNQNGQSLTGGNYLNNQASGLGAYFVFGSFDGTTNPPTVYPNSTSLFQLQNQILIQVSPTSLPAGTNAVLYPPQAFTASGGSFTPPYTWSAANLPSGLSMSSSGILYGTPTQSGTNFVVTVTLTDSLARTVQWGYPLVVY